MEHNMRAFTILLIGIAIVSIGRAAGPDAKRSGDAVTALKSALDEKPKNFADLSMKDFATIPLTKADALAARNHLWESHRAMIREERSLEIKNKMIKEGALEMPFDFKTFTFLSLSSKCHLSS